MGEPKQLMSWHQSTILERAIDNLLGSAVSEVIVVVGHQAEEVIKAIAARPVAVAVNPDYRQGMSTSIAAGLRLIDNRAGAVMLALGDQPLIDSRTINRLLDEFRDHDKGIALPAYQARRGHPVIFAIKYKAELLKLTGDAGGRQIIKDHPDDVLEVAIDSAGVITDIDTEDDYRFYLG